MIAGGAHNPSDDVAVRRSARRQRYLAQRLRARLEPDDRVARTDGGGGRRPQRARGRSGRGAAEQGREIRGALDGARMAPRRSTWRRSAIQADHALGEGR
jgi:hypothetical protein